MESQIELLRSASCAPAGVWEASHT